MPELAEVAPKPSRLRQQKQRLKTPIFFMHIAKTAGSYINERFASALGADTIQTHIEQSIGNTSDLSAALSEDKRFFPAT